jgi:hypothetical protein
MSCFQNPEDMLLKEIDLIQACIGRMAANSFEVKKWAVGITSAILIASTITIQTLLIIIPVMLELCMFWSLDSFFLLTEKRFRSLYNDVVKKRLTGDFENQFDLNPLRYKDTSDGFLKCVISKTLLPFYLVLIVVSVLFLLLKVLSVTKSGTTTLI